MESRDAFIPVFSALDRHFGIFMEKLSGGKNPAVFLAAALTSRRCREGHVCLDLAETAGKPIFPLFLEEFFGPEKPHDSALVCPSLPLWEEVLRASPVVGRPGEYKPLILDDKGRLYLYRYWFYEDVLIGFVQESVDPRTEAEFRGLLDTGWDRETLKEALCRVFPEEGSIKGPGGKNDEAPSPSLQRIAALAVLRKRLVVISGSPGTGKTTTAARIIALLRQLKKDQPLRIALAAPTGKAAGRLEEAMIKACESIDPAFQPAKAMTLHRLLGVIPGSPYFRFRRENPLPYDLVVVDEASMVDLSLMAKLVSALSPTSRLLLLGDRDQLASVEAGAVLGDLCGPGDGARSLSPRVLEERGDLTEIPCALPEGIGEEPVVADSVIFLRQNFRFSENSGIGQLSSAVKDGDFTGARSILNSSSFSDVAWQLLPEPRMLGVLLKDFFLSHFKEYLQAVRNREDPENLFGMFERFRILCALRQGPFGVLAVNTLVEDQLRAERQISGEGRWYAGRPVLITRNDYGLGLFNGDLGLTLPKRNEGRLSVYFRDPEKGFIHFAPFRLPEHETVYAMTVHKSQGSESDEVLLILPDRENPLLTRELLYTGITRAKKRLTLWGREETLEKALSRRIDRVSGLRDALWPTGSKKTK